MHIEVHAAMQEIDASQWNELLHDNNPFMRHEFLHGLEECGCVSLERGWQAQHIAAYSDASRSTLLGAMPCYIKEHSYGEYIFDWAWADAYHRHGLEYYPKLCNAVPFTPATGPRWLAHHSNETSISVALLEATLSLVEEKELSSFHSLFLTEQQASQAQLQGLSRRSSNQFHWENRGYTDFDHFLQQLSSKKRKNIKRERRRVREQEVSYRWVTGVDLEDVIDEFYAYYLGTVRMYGAQAYLNRPFFEHLAAHLPEQTLILLASYGDQSIAGGFYMRSDSALYGRYWGARANFHSVHFETCYYQPIEWCIQHGISRFEAGAQGEHKHARGLEPRQTHSAHWISQAQFRNAIDDFLVTEADHISRYQNALKRHSPFRQEQ